MINRDSELSITRQAELLGFSRGMVYYEPKVINESDLKLMNAIDKLHMDFPFMGARMLRNQLNRQGLNGGRRHVRTLMRRMGICNPPTKKHQLKVEISRKLLQGEFL